MHYDEHFFTDIGIGTMCHCTSTVSQRTFSDVSKVFFFVSLRLPPVLMPKEGCTRKVCKKPAPYVRKKKPSTTKKDVPKTSASVKSTVAQHRENLTLADWLTVFKFIDDHPGIKQMQFVRHFKLSRLARRALSFLHSQHFHENWNSAQSHPMHFLVVIWRLSNKSDTKRRYSVGRS